MFYWLWHTALPIGNTLPTILRLQEVTYLELGNRIPCHANSPAKQKAHLVFSVVKMNLFHCNYMAFYAKSKSTEVLL